MADDTDQKSTASSKSSTGSSPWEEELPPEEPKKKSVVGSLDTRPANLSQSSTGKKPVPFNIPANVAEEKVGKKIPAEEAMKKTAASTPLLPPAPPPSPKLIPPAPKPKVMPEKKIEPAPAVVEIKPDSKDLLPEKKTAPILTSPKPAPIAKTAPKEVKKESGINELIQPKPKEPASIEEKPLQKEAPLPKPFSMSPKEELRPLPESPKIEFKPEPPKIKPIPEPKIEPKIKPAPAVSLPPAPPPPLPAKPKIEPIQEPPSPPPPVPKEEKPKALPSSPTPVEEMAPAEPMVLPDIGPPPPLAPEPTKNLDALKASPASTPPAVPIIPEPTPPAKEEPKNEPPTPAKPPETPAKKAPRQFLGPKKPPFFKRPAFLIVTSVIFLLTLGIYLTEAGVISVGLEKIYGLVGLESLWKGLPRNPEKALGVSVSKMQNQLNFKVKGNISLTVNKTVKSPIVTPLVSMSNLPFAFRDQDVSGAVAALLTQYDYYDDSSSTGTSTPSSPSTYDYYDDSSSTGTSTPSSPSTTDSSSTSSSTTQNSSTSSQYGDQATSSGYQSEGSTIKQIDADFDGESSEDAIKSNIKIKKVVGGSSDISLIDNKTDLYVKSSSDIKFSSDAVPDRWLNIKLNNITENNAFKDLTKIKLDQGFSIIGRRSGNEKVGTVRCYKYTIDDLKIGDSLDFLGITKDQVQKISGAVWIGAADHYIHKVDFQIIPSISSAVSQMSVTFELYDYGVENSINIPVLADKITPTQAAESAAATATTGGDIETRDQTRKNDLVSIKEALEKYKKNNGTYPKASEMIKLNTKDNVVQTALVPEFIASIPTDPMAAEGWYYGYKSDGKTFTLSARLENPADKQVTKVGDIYLHWVYNN